MKRPAALFHRRPATAAARRPRNRTEAAIELVRAEFERERLQRDLDQLNRRVAVSRAGRDANIARSRTLRAILARDDQRDAESVGPPAETACDACGAETPAHRVKGDRR
jgi:hypothetical protein